MPLPTGYPTLFGFVVKNKPRKYAIVYLQTLTNPLTASITRFLTTSAGPNTTTITYARSGYPNRAALGYTVFDGAGADGNNDSATAPMPRNVVITVTHASAVVALSGVIAGVDLYGEALTEAWSVTAGTTSKTFTGKKAFARVDTVTVVAASDASADTVKIGTGVVLGLDVLCDIASLVKEVSGGSVVTNGTVVAQSTASTDDRRGTYSPNSAPNGSTTYVIAYISSQPEYSNNGKIG